ncbi:MAG: GNAT family N-acetyltransferase [Acidimicrobiales bacterium]
MDRSAGILRVASDDELVTFDALVREYVASLPFTLDFQDVDQELADLARQYGPPSGAAFLAIEQGRPVGCVGLRRIEDNGGSPVAELKRMFVQPAARHKGYGVLLCAAAIKTAGELGYDRIRLDTVEEMTAAASIYRRAGFLPISPYRDNPLETARYYELELGSQGAAGCDPGTERFS